MAGLASAGIVVRDDPAGAPLRAATGATTPVQLLTSQVGALAAEARDGAGVAVDDLDSAIGAPTVADDGVGADAIGAITPSVLVDAWMDHAGTPAANLARSIVGRSVGDAAPVVLPHVVLALFTADVAAAGESIPSPASEPSGLRRQPAAGPTPRDLRDGVCSSVIGFVDGVVASVFDAIGHLHSPPPLNTGVGPLDAVANAVASVAVGAVNLAIDGTNFIVSNTVRVAVSTVMSYVGRVASAVGTVALIVSAIRPWTMRLDAAPTEIAAPDHGAVSARIDLGGLDEWPPAVADCAQQSGVPLPPLRPSGNAVAWTVAPNDAIAVDSSEPRLSADAAATLTYSVTRPPPVSGAADVVTAVPVRATVQRDDLTDLETSLIDLVRRTLEQLVPPVGSVVSPLVMPIVRPWIDAAFATLSKLRTVSSATRVLVRSPEPNPTTTTAAPVRAATPYTMVWIPTQATGRPQQPPPLGGYTCAGPGGTWRFAILPQLALPAQTVTLTLGAGATSSATWDPTFTDSGTDDAGDATSVEVDYHLTFTLHDGPTPTMTVSGTVTQTAHVVPKGAPAFDQGPTTVDVSTMVSGGTNVIPAVSLLPGLPDTALVGHPDWQTALRTESRTAC